MKTLKSPITVEKVLTAATILEEKSTSKKWIDALGDDIEVVEDAVFIISLLLAQVRSWNSIHVQASDIFKTIVDAFNNTIVFAKDEAEGENMGTAMSGENPTQTPAEVAE